MAPTVLLILAEGAEEMEAVITVDVLRRGGVTVTIAGLTGAGPVSCSRGVVITPDTSLEEAVREEPYTAVVLPGGAKGAELLSKSDVVRDVLKRQEARNGFIAAICAGPISLPSHGIAAGKSVTSHPSVKHRLEADYKYSEERVVQDGIVVTSRGPGTAFEFALHLVEQLQGPDVRAKLLPPMLLNL